MIMYYWCLHYKLINADERHHFNFTDQFIKKLKEVINVPSLEWLHTSYITGTRGSKWLLQTLLDINRLSKGSPVHASSTEDTPGTEMAACAKDAYGVWLSDILKPLQERILKVVRTHAM